MDFIGVTIELLKAIAAPTVAVAAIVVSSQQVGINRTKLRLELYEKRVAVYEEVRSLLRKFVEAGALDVKDLAEFRTNTAHAAFICPASVTEFLGKIEAAAVELIKREHTGHLVRSGVSHRDPASVDEEIDTARRHFLDLQDTTKAVFLPVLSWEIDSGQAPGTVLQRLRRRLFLNP